MLNNCATFVDSRSQCYNNNSNNNVALVFIWKTELEPEKQC